MPLESRTRATLRSAEFGFFGVVVYTRVHTPRRWGEPFSAGVLDFDTLSWRPLRTSWLMVGTGWFPLSVFSSRSGAVPDSGVLPWSDVPVRPPRTASLSVSCSMHAQGSGRARHKERGYSGARAGSKRRRGRPDVVLDLCDPAVASAFEPQVHH